ncbi:MAG: hypothetical protein JW807_13625 [Spirochaetes bacterium]|nr:hypothetical protein [Spirochaetota bacterium]
MNYKDLTAGRILTAAILAVAIGYGVFYFNYFETPTGDYIGNIRGPVIEYMQGDFPGSSYKFLPLYPLLLSFLTRLNPSTSGDPVYLTAIILNMALLVPYLILAFIMYRRFLPGQAAPASLLFLGVNVYTVYMAINSELEMVLSLLILLSLYLSLRESKFSYAAAFLTAITKWDSVFIVPAVMFRDFFYRKKRIPALVLGACATTGVAAWLALSIINTRGQTYVSEIAHRGPNIYRFIIDCFLVAGGFLQWMATDAWFSENQWARISMLAFVALIGIVTVTGVIWGAVLVFREKRREFAPIFVFFAGFLLIHLIYQNTKDRYVMPVLWILNLFLFYGLSRGIYPWLGRVASRLSPKPLAGIRAALICAGGIVYIISLGAIARINTPLHFIFALGFSSLAAAIIIGGQDKKDIITAALLVLACGIAINLSVYYGVRALDHHGLSRVEFKKVSLWYKDHAVDGDRMLISETNVPKYYSGFGDKKFIISFLIRGNTIEELVPELRKLKTTYVFVDDFYIRRLKVKDPNAIDRRAWIFREIRDKGEKTGHFRLIETFQTKGGITSYLYKFIP